MASREPQKRSGFHHFSSRISQKVDKISVVLGQKCAFCTNCMLEKHASCTPDGYGVHPIGASDVWRAYTSTEAWAWASKTAAARMAALNSRDPPATRPGASGQLLFSCVFEHFLGFSLMVSSVGRPKTKVDVNLRSRYGAHGLEM